MNTPQETSLPNEPVDVDSFGDMEDLPLFEDEEKFVPLPSGGATSSNAPPFGPQGTENLEEALRRGG